MEFIKGDISASHSMETDSCSADIQVSLSHVVKQLGRNIHKFHTYLRHDIIAIVDKFLNEENLSHISGIYFIYIYT